MLLKGYQFMEHTCRVFWGKQSFFRAVTTLFEVYGDYIKCKSRALTDFFTKNFTNRGTLSIENLTVTPVHKNKIPQQPRITLTYTFFPL